MALAPIAAETWFVVPSPIAGDPLVGVANAHGQPLAQGRQGARAVFREACGKPLVGKARRPRTVRVADEALAVELRGAMPGVTVEVEPPGDVARALANRLFFAAYDGPTWGLGISTFAGILALGEMLVDVAPWEVLTASARLRVRDPDLPAETALAIVPGVGFDLLDAPSLPAEARRLRLALRPLDSLPSPLLTPLTVRGFVGRRAPVPVAVAAEQDLAPATPTEARALLRAGKALTMLAGSHRSELAMGVPVAVAGDGIELAFLAGR